MSFAPEKGIRHCTLVYDTPLWTDRRVEIFFVESA
jgi:hypothetical protein